MTAHIHEVAVANESLAPKVVRDMRFEFVTIVYGPEVRLLQLQARSFRRNFAGDQLHRIHVIVNENEPTKTIEEIRRFGPEEYGPFWGKVHISSTANYTNLVSDRGWRTQQILKLLVSRVVETSKYVVLDAKNHVIRPASYRHLFAADGRPFTSWTVQSGSLQNFLSKCVRYFGLPDSISTGRVMPATTPYPLYTQLVRNLLAYVEAREGKPFPQFFMSPGTDITEFFTYYCFLAAAGIQLDEIYRFGPRYAVTLFTRWPDTDEQLAQALSKLEEPHVWVFGLHKNRVAALSPEARTMVEQMWVQAGLFESPAQAGEYYTRLLHSITGW